MIFCFSSSFFFNFDYFTKDHQAKEEQLINFVEDKLSEEKNAFSAIIFFHLARGPLSLGREKKLRNKQI
jgi:hypothetical protein